MKNGHGISFLGLSLSDVVGTVDSLGLPVVDTLASVRVGVGALHVAERPADHLCVSHVYIQSHWGTNVKPI